MTKITKTHYITERGRWRKDRVPAASYAGGVWVPGGNFHDPAWLETLEPEHLATMLSIAANSQDYRLQRREMLERKRLG